ncbi:MAG TPA: SusC/RagA family TonB-linked outer membrane protein, partial [Cyclobacteriaceae bacterium]|nr:SusC/RagA family TonB-linked outer membrane protein [Cyclobacteriaceae bacterium]
NALTAKATYGLDMSVGERVALLSGLSSNISNNATGYGRGQYNENRTTSNLVELTLAYNKKVANVAMEIVGGYSFQSFRNNYMWAQARGFSDFENFGNMENELKWSMYAGEREAQIFRNYNNWGVADVLTGAVSGSGGFVSGLNVDSDVNPLPRYLFARPEGVTVDAIIANYYDQTDYLQSYFARGNFTISDKYLVSATLRIDGSSKFGPDNQYGVFPSGAVAWKLDQEGFIPETFSTLKLRAGYGIVGNQDGLGYGNFIRRDRYADASINDNREAIVPGTTTQGFAEPGLKWEQTAQTSVGLDFGILQDKLSGTFDVYVKNTTDLLLKANTAQPASAPTFFTNLDATVVNKGWELSLSYNVFDKTDASFTISGNVSHNENMLEDFGGALDAGTIRGQGLSLAYAQRLAGGHPLFSYHLREFEGFDSNGQPIGDNQTFVGKSALPTWVAGLSLNARYKGFDLAMYFSGQFGHYVYSNTRNAFFTAGSIQGARNVTKDVLTSGESGTAEAAVSTRFLEKGDFVRMQNFTLGYNVNLGDMKFLRKLRFYVTGQNLFVITDYSGLDPEVSSSPANYDLLNELPTAGIDYTAYPRPRTFTIGLNASF